MNELFKGELYLKDLNETVNLICAKFDEYERQIIKNLEENVSVMSKKVQNLKEEIDKHK